MKFLVDINPIEWNSDDSFGATKDSFIFSFKKNSYDAESYILSRVKEEKCAIISESGFGLSFNSDLTTVEGSGICINQCYEKKIRETEDRFFVEEYEVFQL
jgi:hypothetical protein